MPPRRLSFPTENLGISSIVFQAAKPFGHTGVQLPITEVRLWHTLFLRALKSLRLDRTTQYRLLFLQKERTRSPKTTAGQIVSPHQWLTSKEIVLDPGFIKVGRSANATGRAPRYISSKTFQSQPIETPEFCHLRV